MEHRIGRRLRAWMSLSTLATAALLLGAGTTESCFEYSVEVLSSPPDQVSGGDARIAIGIPRVVPPQQVRVRIDGVDVTDAFELIPGTRTLEGVVTGLALGDNLLEVRSNGNGKGRPAAELVLTNHPIEGPIFSGPHQQPFLCSDAGDRANAELGPAIDADCSVETVVSFKYLTTGGAWVDYDPAAPRPSDMSETTTMDGDTVDFIVRWERGTINRFIYSLAMLSPGTQDEAAPDLSAWNRRLIYYFQGGVGIGRYQGDPSRSRMLYTHGLSLGYAVAYSTGTKTGEHYNLELGGETAIMVKDRFVSAYGNPDYTVGVGGSGGGIQQYVYAQNHEGLIDAGVPQRSYPDMISQTIHIGDCELLERWIDLQVAAGSAKWADWENRTELEGLNALNGFDNDFLPLIPWLPQGSSECVNGWRGLSPLVLNPLFGTAPGISLPDQLSTEWTHFGDAVNIYGVAADGFAASTWDNVGVQYGVDALVSGFLDPDEFLDLNAQVGSWKNEPDMVQDGCPFIFSECFQDPSGLPPFPDVWPGIFDPWSWRNMALSPDGGITPAPRKEADPGAIEAAYNRGHVNIGDVQIPLIDVRDYLEDQLDMHNSVQSFVSRQRLLDFDGDASNQVIWFTEPGGRDLTPPAFAVIDEWMRNIEANPHRSVAENKPAAAVDSCYDSNGALIHAGDDAWAGILDDDPDGPCTSVMPPYGTSRIVAGGPITGDVFKCHLIPVDDAISAGLYGGVSFDAAQKARLEAIFPTGVCDYSQGDARRP
jgi:hypothetical protein